MTSRPAVLFDIDGTLADVGHRVHLLKPEREGGKDWDAFFDAMDSSLIFKNDGSVIRRALIRPSNS
jgi:FMN phosphatase YigB (HAD superfamily)